MTIKFFALLCLVLACNTIKHTSAEQTSTQRTSYYFSNEGNDVNVGSLQHPFKTPAIINKLHLNGGDSILFKGNETFIGSIQFTMNSNTKKNFFIGSYANGAATINAGNESAIVFSHSSNVIINNIKCVGSGRKNGSTKPGIFINECNNISINNIDVSGFQKSGVQLYSCVDVNINKVNAHDNGAAGIGVEGDYRNKLTSRNITIKNCSAINNPGDPSNLNNHSGNGIVVGHCTNVLIDHCMASNNGWDMPRIGNGPVGIWCYEADSIIIQHCISCKNKTAKGADDGGGYDLDGGTTNSLIQYCLSYENQGSAFGLFQYVNATPWHDNVVRFCISKNDGNVSPAQANAYIWNNSGDSTQFKNLLFYNNTLYNDSNAVIDFASQHERSGFKFFNNIFVAKNSLITGFENRDNFIANNWWSLGDKFNINGDKNFQHWATKNHQEQLNDTITGLNILPQFINPNDTTFTQANQIEKYNSFRLINATLFKNAAINLQQLFRINVGEKDFNNKPVNKKCIGASTN